VLDYCCCAIGAFATDGFSALPKRANPITRINTALTLSRAPRKPSKLDACEAIAVVAMMPTE
jgi:hypothetical protein